MSFYLFGEIGKELDPYSLYAEDQTILIGQVLAAIKPYIKNVQTYKAIKSGLYRIRGSTVTTIRDVLLK